MSESDKSGKPELTSDDFKLINEWVGEIYYKSPPHTDNWNELQGIAERATLHERSAAQARIAELPLLSEVSTLRSKQAELVEENQRLKQELQDEKDYLRGIIKQTEQDAAREIDKYRP